MILYLSGQKFGKWLVLGRGTRRSHWMCRCDCGTERSVLSSDMLSGKSLGCGKCFEHQVKHGHNKRGKTTTEYRAWSGMKDRCTNPRGQFWSLYGGRGISVCVDWLESFESFLAYMGPKPSPSHSIDRYPNQDGNYEPGNVRWATKREQSGNRRGRHFLEHNGKRQILADWARELGISKSSLRDRLRYNSVADSLSFGRGGARSGDRR